MQVFLIYDYMMSIHKVKDHFRIELSFRSFTAASTAWYKGIANGNYGNYGNSNQDIFPRDKKTSVFSYKIFEDFIRYVLMEGHEADGRCVCGLWLGRCHWIREHRRDFWVAATMNDLWRENKTCTSDVQTT